MDKRATLIKQCRYYRGEDKSPFDSATLSWFWDMERVYVNSDGQFKGEREYYKGINGRVYPNIPFDLLIVMFTSWGKYTYFIEENIDKFYKLVDEYLHISDLFPEASDITD